MKIATRIALLAVAFATTGGATSVTTPSPDMHLWRLQCGKDQPLPMPMFSDAYRYAEGQTKQFTFSCYLIKHGQDYMVWDAGLPAEDGTRIADQLRQLNIPADQVKYLGISHFHFDHIGQAADFPTARLLIGAADLEAVKKGDRLPDNSTDSAVRLAPWVTGGAPVEALGTRDFDVFGDGSVMMMNTPGHSPGHHSLLIRLSGNKNYMLSGDLFHFTQNRTARQVPIFNTSRADTLASMARFEEVAKRLKAVVIIQHEPSDIAKLPKFPAAAD